MANTPRYSLGIGRGKERARGKSQDTAIQPPFIKPDSEFAHTSTATVQASIPVGSDDISTYDPEAGGDTLKYSRLSVEAKEFYPSNYIASSSEVSGAMPVAPPVNEEKGDVPAELVSSHLLDIVNTITVEPGSYKNVVQPFLESFGATLTDSDALNSILNIIFEQSIMQPNFRYNGARLCNDLNEFLADKTPEFRNIILNRCKEEVILVLKYFDSDPVRLQGFVCFLAELYIQLELKPGTRLRILILGDAVYELLEQLVSVPVPDNIKCTCMTLKLAGYALEQDNSPAMDKLLQSLHKAALSPANTNVAAMVANIEQLRLASWGTNMATEPSTSVTNFYQNVSDEETEPVFYGPDGIVLTHEESVFLQENVMPELDYYDESWVNGTECEYDCEGEMNEEEEAAYEEFLRMSENNKKQ